MVSVQKRSIYQNQIVLLWHQDKAAAMWDKDGVVHHRGPLQMIIMHVLIWWIKIQIIIQITGMDIVDNQQSKCFMHTGWKRK